MSKGVARKRLLEFVLVIFPWYGCASSPVTEGAPTYWPALRARREVGVSERHLVRCASSGHCRRVRWGGVFA